MKLKNTLQALKTKVMGKSPGEKMKLSNKKVIGAAVVAFVAVLTVVLIHPERTNAMKRITENTSKTYYKSTANNMYIYMKGPSGTSTLQIRASWTGSSSTSASTFRGQARHVTLTGKIVGSNPYKLTFKNDTYKTEKAASGNYVNISFNVGYTKPAHQQGNGKSFDVPDGTATTNNFGDVNDHASSAETKTIKMTVSLYNFGIITFDNKKSNGKWEHLRFYDTSATYNMHYYETRPLSFDSRGGSAVAQKTAKDSTYFTNFSKPTRTGYTFAGWYDSASGGTQRTSVFACKDGIKKLYAHWTANKYTIKYHGNGATSGSMANSTATYDSNFTLPANAFKRDYYVFAGWATSSGGKKAYNDKAVFKPFNKTSDLNLYAVWTPANYNVTVKFDGNGGTCNATTKTVKVMSNITLPSSEVTREGFTLIGWTLNKNDKDNYEKPGAIIKANSDMTYYAVWKSSTGNANLSNVITDSNMFKGDEELEGSDGTSYNSMDVDSKMAHPDGGIDNPGYFTER